MSDPSNQAPPSQPAAPQPAPAWAAPAAPPFGPPPGRPGAAAYAPPPGYAGPYGAPPAAAVVAPAVRGSRLGLVALIAALGAAVVAPVVASIAAFYIGTGAAATSLLAGATELPFDWAVLTPVRGWVLLAEICFWVGTGLGVWAIVQGIIAIVTNRGRGFGLAAVVVAVLGVFVFAAAVGITLRVALGG